jgi:hypothetical protein
MNCAKHDSLYINVTLILNTFPFEAYSYASLLTDPVSQSPI